MSTYLFYSPEAGPVFDNAVRSAIGGAELRAYTFAKYLASKGNKIFFVVNELSRQQITKDGIIVKTISYNQKNKIGLIQKIKRRILYKTKFKNSIGFEDFLKNIEIFQIYPDHIFVFGLTGNSLKASKICSIIKSKLLTFIASDEDVSFEKTTTHSATRLETRFDLASEIINNSDKIFVQNNYQKTALENTFKTPLPFC